MTDHLTITLSCKNCSRLRYGGPVQRAYCSHDLGEHEFTCAYEPCKFYNMSKETTRIAIGRHQETRT